MRNTSLVICILLINNCTFAQATANQIEINPYFQWNSYPSFTTPYNSAMNSTIKMKGDNWGVGIFYNYAHKKRIFTKAGVGYYKYGFTDIREYTHLFSRNARDINYPDGSSTFGYVCNKYWYHNITVTIGIEKLFKLRKSNVSFRPTTSWLR